MDNVFNKELTDRLEQLGYEDMRIYGCMKQDIDELYEQESQAISTINFFVYVFNEDDVEEEVVKISVIKADLQPNPKDIYDYLCCLSCDNAHLLNRLDCIRPNLTEEEKHPVVKQIEADGTMFILDRIVVNPNLRGIGIGSEMIQLLPTLIEVIDGEIPPHIVLLASAFEVSDKQQKDIEDFNLMEFYAKAGYTAVNRNAMCCFPEQSMKIII